MQDSHDPRLDLSVVRTRYNDPLIYASADNWHRFTAEEIQREIGRLWDSILTRTDSVILNAGSGGNDLGLLPRNTINLDISERRIRTSSRPLVASVEAIPLKNESVDILLCVGSVVNYCDVAIAISEFERVLRPEGILVLEFESSKSAEFIKQDIFGRSAAVAETFFGNQAEAVWVYSPTYVRNLLSAAGFSAWHQTAIHILSPWILLLLRNVNAAALIGRLDRVARHVGFLNRFASNHLVFYQKGT